MDRAELEAANQALLAKRKALGIGQPKSIDEPIRQVVDRNGMTIADYFAALQAGQLAVPPDALEEIDTSRVKWDSFDSDRHPSLQKGVKIIKQWYNDRIDSGGAIILAGNCGCGKTHLADAIYKLYGFGAAYWNEADLVEKLQAGYGNKGGRDLESVANQCRRSKLLIFDDLGAYETDNLKWMQNIYMTLFDGRPEAGRATFITTNLQLYQKIIEAGKDTIYSPIEHRLGGRVYSRLMGAVDNLTYYVNLFDVPDYRLRNF